MNSTLLGFLFGWAALLSAVATVATLITGILFFTLAGPFGKINDAASVFQMVFMLPVAGALFLLSRPDTTGLDLLTVGIGVTGMVTAGVLQALLVFGAVEFEQTIGATLMAGGAIGLWLILVNVLALSGKILPTGLVAFGMVAGAGYILLAIGFRKRRQQHPLFYAGSLLGVVGYSIWATWVSRIFQTGGPGG